MTDSSSNVDKGEMAELAADLFQAKLEAKEASRGMTHLLKIGQFHIEIVPNNKVDVAELFDDILAKLYKRYGDKLLLSDRVLGVQAGMHQ
jgi:hypothetical protein